MEQWLELGRWVHVLLGVFWVAVVLLTILATCRLPKADPGVAGRSPERSFSDELRKQAGAVAAMNSLFDANDTRIREGS